MNKRMVIYSSVFLIIGLALAVYVVRNGSRAPGTAAAPAEFDRPDFPWIRNVREATALMRSCGMLDEFGCLKSPWRSSDSKTRDFRKLVGLGLLDILRKKPSATEFSYEDYVYGLRTLRALAMLAQPYIEDEVRGGRPAEARKAAHTLSVLALNYPRGTFAGNTGGLRRMCSELLQTLELNMDWEALTAQAGCLVSATDVRFSTEGTLFARKEWQSFFESARNDEERFRFLVRRFADKRPTKIHICNFRNAAEGEVAVFAAQQVLRENWFAYDGYNERLREIAGREAPCKALLLKDVLEDKELCSFLQDYFRARASKIFGSCLAKPAGTGGGGGMKGEKKK